MKNENINSKTSSPLLRAAGLFAAGLLFLNLVSIKLNASSEQWYTSDTRGQSLAFADTADEEVNLQKNCASFPSSSGRLPVRMSVSGQSKTTSILTSFGGFVTKDLGTGGVIRFSGSEGYREFDIGVPFAFRVKNVSFGVMNRLLATGIAFDPDDSLVISERQRRANWALDLGFIYRVQKNIALALALRNINQPDMGQIAVDRLPLEIDVGGRVGMGEKFTLRFAVVYARRSELRRDETRLSYSGELWLLKRQLALSLGMSQLNISDVFQPVFGFEINPSKVKSLTPLHFNYAFSLALSRDGFVAPAQSVSFSWDIPFQTRVEKTAPAAPAKKVLKETK